MTSVSQRALLAFALVALAACASVKTSITALGPLADAPKKSDTPANMLPAFEQHRAPDRPYEIVGKVYASVNDKRGRSGDEDSLNWQTPPDLKMVSALDASARRLGADALVGLYQGGSLGYLEKACVYSSALAVKYLEPGKQPAERAAPLVIGILPMHSAEPDPKHHAKLDMFIRKSARLWLEERGYYVVTPENVPFDGDARALVAVDAAKIREWMARDVDAVLVLDLNSQVNAEMLIAGGRSFVVKAGLVSIRDRKVVWEDTVCGTATAGWIIRMFDVLDGMAADATGKMLANKLPVIVTEGLNAPAKQSTPRPSAD